MTRAGRMGDRSHVPVDSHGAACCAHSASGPAVTGSANVLINGKPALRVGDRGQHGGCCGENEWVARSGAPRVLINARKAHRLQDEDWHCGGAGALVEASPDVLIGDHIAPDPGVTAFTPKIVLQDMPGPLGAPLREAPWRLVLRGRVVETGKTDAEGRVNLLSRLEPDALYELHYPGRTMELTGRAPPPITTLKGLQMRLAALGYHPGHIGGRDRGALRVALLHFQQDHGLPRDGDPEDAATLSRIQEQAGF